MKRKTILLYIIGACLCLCTACKSPSSTADKSNSKGKEVTTININDYIITDYSGYNTIGHDNVCIDISSLILENRSLFGLKIDATDAQFQPILSCLEKNITYTKSNSNSTSQYLSNGDVITIDFDEEKIKELNNTIDNEDRWNVKFDCKDTNITVEGLEELKEYNINELLTVHCFEHECDDNQLEVIIEYKVSTPEEIAELENVLQYCEVEKSELGKDYVKLNFSKEISQYADGLEGFKIAKGFTLSQESYDIKFVDKKVISNEEDLDLYAYNACNEENFHGTYYSIIL